MANKSGVFFPMYQREAMWISFEAKSKFAIRVFVGGINAVSGRPWNAPPRTTDAKQDYIVAPPQEWLDGIAVSKDTVKQFVAMPIGTGYSIEKQLTGKEDIGGLQLEITPSGGKLEVRRTRGSYDNPSLTLSKSPRQCGISAGSEVFLKNMGNGFPTLGGKEREIRPRLLRELRVDSDGPLQPNLPLTALYSVRLKIIDSTNFRKHAVVTQEFSPFVLFDEVRKRTILKDMPLSNFELHHDGKRLESWSKLVDAGLSDNAVIDARIKSEYEKPKRNLGLGWFRQRKHQDVMSQRQSYQSYQPQSHYSYPQPMLPQSYPLGGVFTQGMDIQSAPLPSFAKEDTTGWSMGLAAGGRLRQQILPDSERPYTWNKSGTSVVSVQIPNSVAFEGLMGILTPPSPITLEHYVAAGYLFYEFYREMAAATTGQHYFRQIKSIGEIDFAAGDVQVGTSVAVSQKVACTSCRKRLCDSM
ncbi:hypothetical protein W97_09257 [Coniosporium apollinis CBS 100218]|uniref:Ubiquitin-like domain-containing protein n=1 Tax=Coniosporium apollinis (strain CBS 100218) TaxID=1168221 RepID=R7Z7S4_CONA1|nr:uncharacterized protein W97_09257 [Coniosporium apollinis CBS 100218]EON69991.1 hypothetical protein W97_09257 [Coniosporium apollinis CBS 100218]